MIDPSPPSDAAIRVQVEDGPTDGTRLLACLQGWAPHPDRSPRLHYCIRSSGHPGDLPDAAQLRARLQGLTPQLPAPWSEALLQGWPPPLRGLHRIEVVPGAGWVSIATGLRASLQRDLDARWRTPARRSQPADAIVVGAGLAGCAMADALTRRGWYVTVLERGECTGGAVAEIPLLAQHPALSPGEDRRSRLLVAALLASGRLAQRLGDAMHRCGRFQPMPLAQARTRTAGIPASVAHPVANSTRAAHGVQGWQGIWYPDCAMVSPQRWWRRLLQDPALDLHLSSSVAAIRRDAGQWQALDGDGEVIASAAVMILACQAHSLDLAGMPEAARGRLRLSSIRVSIGTAAGGVAQDAADPAAVSPRRILGGSSYRLEDPGSHCVIGPVRADDDCLQHIDLPGSTIGDAAYRWRFSQPAQRLLFRDNLPMIGGVPDTAAIMASARQYERNDRLALPRRQSLHLLTGLGGRGLLWSVLGAEMIAAAIGGEPPVVEPDLYEAVDPARFLRRSLRRAGVRTGQADGTNDLSS